MRAHAVPVERRSIRGNAQREVARAAAQEMARHDRLMLAEFKVLARAYCDAEARLTRAMKKPQHGDVEAALTAKRSIEDAFVVCLGRHAVTAL